MQCHLTCDDGIGIGLYIDSREGWIANRDFDQQPMLVAVVNGRKYRDIGGEFHVELLEIQAGETHERLAPFCTAGGRLDFGSATIGIEVL